jgi:hypothetical protein
MAPAELDDLRLDLLARFLPLAHPASVTQNEITALESSLPAWHSDLRALLSNQISMKGTPMTVRYDAPNIAARAGNELIRWLAEAGISIAGTRALRVRGRKSGKRRGVVINVLSVDGRDYVVSPRGNTQWARNARRAGVVEMGPWWRSRDVRIAEVTDDTKPQLLKRYLDRWYWEVKGHVGGLTPQSTDDEMRSAAPSIPVFELLR